MKRKQFFNILIVVVTCSIVIVSIVYAILQSTLEIDGQVNVTGKWKVKFENLSQEEKNGSVSVKSVNLSETQFQLGLEFIKPLDSVTYTFDVRNDGNIDAKVSTIITPDLQALNANHLTYDFTYADGSEINVNDLLPSCKQVNDDSCVKRLKLTVKFNNVDVLNDNPIELSLDSSILYVQA